MGFFDRFTSKKPTPAPAPAATPEPAAAVPPPASEPVPAPRPASGSPAATKTQLTAAREKLGLKDLAGAMAIYEELLTGAGGDRADVLVAISGDLGSHGHVAEIVELIAPRYDADRHGPATGLNLLQAYLAIRNPDAAQHILDILFALERPELEDRLHGFSNAIAEMLASPDRGGGGGSGGGAPAPGHQGEIPTLGLITVSKPIWFYGLEPLAAEILPPKEGRLRRLAFAHLSLPGFAAGETTPPHPDSELPRLARAIPLWFAETFYFSALYSPIAAIGIKTPPAGQAENRHVVFGAEWTIENLRQLVETSGEGLDYIFTGALRVTSGDYEIVLRVWEVKTFRERKSFTARWTPSTVDAALAQLQGQVRAFMEWSPASAAFAYTQPAQARPWLDTIGASLTLFLREKNILAADQLAPVEADLQAAGQRAAASEGASLAYLTLRDRAVRIGTAAPADVPLARSPLVQQAQKILA